MYEFTGDIRQEIEKSLWPKTEIDKEKSEFWISKLDHKIHTGQNFLKMLKEFDVKITNENQYIKLSLLQADTYDIDTDINGINFNGKNRDLLVGIEEGFEYRVKTLPDIHPTYLKETIEYKNKKFKLLVNPIDHWNACYNVHICEVYAIDGKKHKDVTTLTAWIGRIRTEPSHCYPYIFMAGFINLHPTFVAKSILEKYIINDIMNIIFDYFY